MPTLGELHSVKMQLEAGLDQLRQRLGQVEEQLLVLRAAERSGQVSSLALQQYEDLVLELRREIQRRKIAVSEIDNRIIAAESDEQSDRLRQLQQSNAAMMDELDAVRADLLKSLRGMAELVRRHQRLAEEKTSLSAELARLTGRDYAYENYISCALLHKKDYTGDVQFVVDTIKKMRPVT